MRSALLLLLTALASSAPCAAADVRVIDGDTIVVDGQHMRLWGIDAPETKQDCPDGWPAGREATRAITELARGRNVRCEPMTTDRYGRTVAKCTADGDDLSASMVRAGMAWAFVRYSREYVGLEAEAKAARIGVHVHQCQPAWEWRAAHRQ